MTPSENDLKDFFTALRADDERTAAPPFPGLEQRKPWRRVRYLTLPLGAAATILFLLLVFHPAPEKLSAPDAANVIVISLENRPDDTGTEYLLSAQDPISSWESPSASLIADF